MKLKNNEKCEEELTCRFKIDIRNLMNFDSRTQKTSKIYTLMGCFWPKYIMFELKKYNYISWHESVMQNLKKNWLAVWKMTWGI